MTRRSVLALLSASHLKADDSPARRMLLDASRALQEGAGRRFLRYFDKERCEQFPALQESILALTAQRVIASSVDIQVMEESTDRAVMEIDWLLQLTYPRHPGKIQDRRETVRIEADLTGKEPRITAVSPISLFRP